MDIRINKINSVDINKINELTASKQIDEKILNEANYNQIQYAKIPTIHMTRSEYLALMANRPLIKYRPLRNSFLKRGDKKILAAGLGIPESEVDKYIANIINNVFIEPKEETNEINQMQNGKTGIAVSDDDIKLTEAYIFRHGTKEQVLKWLKYELSDAAFVLGHMYRILDDNTNSIYRYYNRPCHLLDNHTAKRMHVIITDSLDQAMAAGFITSSQNAEAANWALRQIYNIQNNNKIIQALKFVRNNS